MSNIAIILKEVARHFYFAEITFKIVYPKKNSNCKSRAYHFDGHHFSVQLNNDLVNIIQKFSEHYHDAWAGRKLENGWQYGEHFSDSGKTHPRLKPYGMLSEHVS